MKVLVNTQNYNIEDPATKEQKTVYFCGYMENGEYKEQIERYNSPQEAQAALNN